MPVKCPSCGLEFGDLQFKIGEFYNAFGELVSRHECPNCKKIVLHSDIEGDWLEEEVNEVE